MAQPVDISAAEGAQVPLVSFTIPNFPPSSQSLKSLRLTSDIKVDEYLAELDKPFAVPPLPAGIHALTLELFSLGYPPGFLTALAERLPNLKTVVIYSQLFAGITEKSQQDAIEFFKKLPNLRALHLLDVFARPHFFSDAAQWLKYNTSDVPGEARRGLMFLEVNYTFRHEDEEFMAKIQATELPTLIGPGLIACTFNLAEPETAEDDEQDPSTIQQAGNKEGIMAFNKTLAVGLVDALTQEDSYPRGLKALNVTLYTLTVTDLEKILAVQKNIMLLSATLDVEPGENCKKAILKSIEQCKRLEQVEIVANPSLQFFIEVQNPRSGVLGKTFPSATDMEALSAQCSQMNVFEASVLRTTTFGAVKWKQDNGQWTGGVTNGKGEVVSS
ncbi:Hypothetical protein R9X50_00183900 [Acrodontium crateriforme]|uniref:Uncharacterized protein n=1 Tax=Acrodontium crateriforme TaxID=150365 RepID=A0AAQ3M019_9PEZI|nr:Hypothetical protein R9X50_00183900 [Acrodontium crateriforme]